MVIDLTVRRKHFETPSLWEPDKWDPITEEEFDNYVVKNRKFYNMYYEGKYQYFVHVAIDSLKFRRW